MITFWRMDLFSKLSRVENPGEQCVLLILESLLALREHLLNWSGSCQKLVMGFVASAASLQMIWLQDGPGGPAWGVCQ